MSVTRFVLVLGCLAAIGPLSVDMYLPAFPSMADSLSTSLAAIEGSLASYFAGLSLGQLFYGPVADRLGRKRPLIFGLSLYVASSIACALALSVGAIVALRFLQALGACSGMVISRAIVRDRFTHQESARIFSLLMLIMGVAPILAPLAGGFVSESLGWRAIFWILAAFSGVCLVAVALLLPETHVRPAGFAPDKVLPTYGRIIRNREFLSFALPGSIAQAGMFAYITGSPFVFIEVFGIPASRFGWFFGANAVGLIVMSQVNSRLLRFRGYQRILAFSFPTVAIAGTCLLLAGVTNAGFWAVAVPLFVYVATLGTTFPNTTAGALASQGRNAGSASALLGTVQMLSASLASFIVSRLHADSAVVMTSVVGSCGLISLLLWTLRSKSPQPT